MIRTSAILLPVLFFGIATATPANAKDTDIGHHGTDAVKAFCDGTSGGVYREGSGIYGCKWVRGNGAYGVLCDQESCFYTTPYARQTYSGSNALDDLKNGKLDAGGDGPPWIWILVAVIAALAGFFAGRSAGSRRSPTQPVNG